jgi:methionyl-tRNA formyltransferase
MTTLRLAFMGSPDFALPGLAALADAGHDIRLVFSQPPRPAGRGHKERPCPVQAFAETRGWPVRNPRSLKNEGIQAELASHDLDAIVVIAYGLILPQAVLDLPRLGCINLHASLLPRWRGAAPIQRAILAGDRESGVTVMMMEAGLDSGPMLLQAKTPITATTTGDQLHDTLAELGAPLLVKALDQLARGALQPQAQPTDGITYAEKLSRTESQLDWRREASCLERQIRAFTSWPGSFFETEEGEKIKVLESNVLDLNESASPGTLLDDRLTVACGEGALRLLRLQRPGKKPLTSDAFLRGHPFPAGLIFPLPDHDS